MNNFSKNITKLIVNNNIKQKDLAKDLNVEPATICNWCKGKRYPNINLL